MTTENLFKKVFGNSVNFMTPEPIKWVKLGSTSGIEVSYGTFSDKQLYGVTVILGENRQDDLGKVFMSLEECNSYLNKLEEKYNELEEVPKVTYSPAGIRHIKN